MSNKVALITGSAKRIGAALAKHLHAKNYNIILHYRQSQAEANQIAATLNQQRENSAITLSADLNNYQSYQHLMTQVAATWQRFDVLINNASSFFPTPLGEINLAAWEDLMNSNLRAPFFLSQAAISLLEKTQGQIINITDIRAEKPLKNYPVYCIAKAGLKMLTQSFAKELAEKKIRVNAIAPGAILSPSHEVDHQIKQKIIDATPLKKFAGTDAICQAVDYLLNADFVTGETLHVDGGRLL